MCGWPRSRVPLVLHEPVAELFFGRTHRQSAFIWWAEAAEEAGYVRSASDEGLRRTIARTLRGCLQR